MKELLYLKDDQIKDCIQLLLYAYRETFSDPKDILKKNSLGAAHHRTLHLIERNEGISVNELLVKLKITKQSLNRVLKDLIKLNVIIFKKDEKDTRIKHVFLNENGIKLFNEIFSIQKKRIYNAFLKSKSEEVISFNNVLKKIINGKL